MNEILWMIHYIMDIYIEYGELNRAIQIYVTSIESLNKMN